MLKIRVADNMTRWFYEVPYSSVYRMYFKKIRYFTRKGTCGRSLSVLFEIIHSWRFQKSANVQTKVGQDLVQLFEE